MEEIVTINVQGAFLILKNILACQYPAGIADFFSGVSEKKKKRKRIFKTTIVFFLSLLMME